MIGRRRVGLEVLATRLPSAHEWVTVVRSRAGLPCCSNPEHCRSLARIGGWRHCGLALVMVLVTLGCCAPAEAVWVWGAPVKVDSHSLSDIECPSVSLCVAIDPFGTVVSSTHPSAVLAGWKLSAVGGWSTPPPALGHERLSCASSLLCVAAGDSAGDVFTSVQPAGGPSAWVRATVDAGTVVTDVACPTIVFCVGVDWNGNVLSTRNPSGGPGAWSSAFVDKASNYLCFKNALSGPGCLAGLVAVSCPSVVLCVATDGAGNILNSRDPAGGASAWTKPVNDAVPESYTFSDVSCPTVSLCVAVDDFAGDIVSWNPSSPLPHKYTPVINKEQGVIGTYCRTTSDCFVWNSAGDIYVQLIPPEASPPGQPRASRAGQVSPSEWSAQLR
jgi:hypothetical protein